MTMLLMPKMMKRTICTSGCTFFANLFNGYAVEDTKHSSLALLVSFCYVILSAQILSKDLFIFVLLYSYFF